MTENFLSDIYVLYGGKQFSDTIKYYNYTIDKFSLNYGNFSARDEYLYMIVKAKQNFTTLSFNVQSYNLTGRGSLYYYNLYNNNGDANGNNNTQGSTNGTDSNGNSGNGNNTDNSLDEGSSTSDELNLPLIIGLSVGGFAFLVIIGVFIFFLSKRISDNQRQYQQMNKKRKKPKK